MLKRELEPAKDLRYEVIIPVIIFWGMCYSNFTVGFFTFAYPYISGSPSFPWLNTAWSLIFYFMLIAAFIGFSIHLAARYGCIRVFRLSLLLLLATSLFYLVCERWDVLLAIRALQGIAAAGIQGTCVGLMLEYTQPSNYKKIFSRSGIALVLGLFLGMVYAGLMLHYLSWQVGAAGFALPAAAIFLASHKIKNMSVNLSVHIDYIGVLLFLLFIVSLVLALGLASLPNQDVTLIRSLFFVSVIAFLFFVFHESKETSTFVDLSLFMSMRSVITIMASFVFGVVFVLFYFLPSLFFFFTSKGTPTPVLALYCSTPAVGMLLVMFYIYYARNAFKRPYLLILGALIVFLSLGFIGWANIVYHIFIHIFLLFLFGLGAGFVGPGLIRAAFLYSHQNPIETMGTLRIFQNLGYGVGVAATLFFIEKYLQLYQDNLHIGFQEMGTFVQVISLICIIFIGLYCLLSWIERIKKR